MTTIKQDSLTAAPPRASSQGLWLISPFYDLTFIIFSSVLLIVPHLAATVLGLAAVLHASALAFQILKYAGVAYLFYVAYATWRDKSAFAVDGTMSKISAAGLVVKAFLLNILNPKLTIFFLAFLPQFVEPGTSQPLFQLLLLSAVFMLMTFVVFVAYGLVAHGFRRLVVDSDRVQNWLRFGFVTAFAGLGAKLALSEK